MWRWFKNFWSPHITVQQLKSEPKTEAKGLGPYRTGVEPSWYPPVPHPGVEEKPDLISVLRGVVEEAAEEQVKLQQKFLTNDKLRDGFQKSMKYVLSKLSSDNYDFVLVHRNYTGIPEEAFGLFMQIFVKACSEIGIAAEASDSYINVRKSSVRNLLKTIPTKTLRVDVDERARAMLGQTP